LASAAPPAIAAEEKRLGEIVTTEVRPAAASFSSQSLLAQLKVSRSV
jgi:hypothetical protein